MRPAIGDRVRVLEIHPMDLSPEFPVGAEFVVAYVSDHPTFNHGGFCLISATPFDSDDSRAVWCRVEILPAPIVVREEPVGFGLSPLEVEIIENPHRLPDDELEVGKPVEHAGPPVRRPRDLEGEPSYGAPAGSYGRAVLPGAPAPGDEYPANMKPSPAPRVPTDFGVAPERVPSGVEAAACAVVDRACEQLVGAPIVGEHVLLEAKPTAPASPQGHGENTLTSKDTNPKDAVAVAHLKFSALPWRVLVGPALALTEGGWKYGRHNYRVAGVKASVYFDAMLDHLLAWYEGEDIDPASGLHHLDKLMAGCMVLRDAQLGGICSDDRPPAVAGGWIEDGHAQTKALFERMQASHGAAKAPFVNKANNK